MHNNKGEWFGRTGGVVGGDTPAVGFDQIYIFIGMVSISFEIVFGQCGLCGHTHTIQTNAILSGDK